MPYSSSIVTRRKAVGAESIVDDLKPEFDSERDIFLGSEGFLESKCEIREGIDSDCDAYVEDERLLVTVGARYERDNIGLAERASLM